MPIKSPVYDILLSQSKLTKTIFGTEKWGASVTDT